MNENLNLVEILKDCPKGTKLYSSVFGSVELDHIDIRANYPIVIRLKDLDVRECLTTEGTLFTEYDGECILFPSRDQRDWSKFEHKKEGLVSTCELKDGDILSYQTVRFATEEEKQKLFEAIKDNCYEWNAETKTLKKLVEPRFKVGDWVASNLYNSSNLLRIIGVDETNYEVVTSQGSTGVPSIRYIDKHFHLWTIQDVKDGDVLVNGSNIFIFYFINNRRLMGYCHVNMNDGNFYNDIGRIECFCTIDAPVTPATKEQRDALMKAMNDTGYEWDSEKKELKKLVPNKFDPKTLQVFDKVLVRLTRDCIWNATFFSHYDKEVNWGCHPCVTTSCKSYDKCIPYNDETKHLLGTSDEAPEYYRYWED